MADERWPLTCIDDCANDHTGGTAAGPFGCEFCQAACEVCPHYADGDMPDYEVVCGGTHPECLWSGISPANCPEFKPV